MDIVTKEFDYCALFYSLQMTSRDAVFLVDRAGIVLSVNPAGATLLNLSEREVVSQNIRQLCKISDISFPKYFPPASDVIEASLWSFVRVPMRAGDPVYIATTAISEQEELKEVRDTLAQVLLEKQQAELAFEDLIALMPGYVFWQDLAGNFLGCNDLQAKALGLSLRDEIIGTTLADYDNGPDFQRANSFNKRVISSNKTLTVEEKGQYHGKERTLLSQKTPMHDASGNTIAILTISFDITERKVLEAELIAAKQRAENTLESLLNLLPGHVYWKNKNGIILGCNTLQAKTAGFNSPTEMIGKSGMDMPVEIQTPENDKKVMQLGETLTFEEEMTLASGVHTYLSKKAPFRDDENEVIGVLAVSFDISARKQAEKELREAKEKAEEANLAKTNFIANMSHDLRTPLHAILGMSEMLKLHDHYPEQIELINNILSSGRSLLYLIEDILDFSKNESNAITLNTTSFDLKRFLENILTIFAPQAEQKKLKLTLDYPESIPRRLVNDQDALKRVFLNLLNNAIKFTHTGGITLSVHQLSISNDTLVLDIRISDTGIGMYPEDLNRVFDRFYRAHNAQDKHDGSGLGLSIVEQFVKALKGSIRAESILNEGSTFHCALPFTLAKNTQLPQHIEENKQVEKSASNTVSPQFSLLLVEDNQLAQRVSTSILEELGCKVAVASTGEEAYQKSISQEFDLIFMDIGLPDKDGLVVTKAVREQKITTPIIALTAHASQDDKITCLNSGMDGFLVKPASYDDFQAALEKHLL